jgi:hypothetical protein
VHKLRGARRRRPLPGKMNATSSKRLMIVMWVPYKDEGAGAASERVVVQVVKDEITASSNNQRPPPRGSSVSIARPVPRSSLKALPGALIPVICLVVCQALAAQTSATAAGKPGPARVSAELPDAPTPAAVILAANESSPGVVISFLDPQQKPLPKSDDQNPQAPTLGDLGLSPDQTKTDPDAQHRLDRRTHDLKVHQELGIVTLAPLAAACITSALAPPDPRNGRSGNTTGRDVHVSLGSLSVAMYGATAFYAIKAPRIPGEGPTKGGIKLHKYLIYIHAPGMILTPILGAMAFNQAADGEKVHGIASAHAAVAWTTVAAYSAAIVAVSWPIHLPFRK